MKRVGTSWAQVLPFSRKGAYYRACQVTTVNATASTVLAVDKLYAAPLRFNADVVIDRIGVEVTTGATAGGVARLGIYSDNDMVPGSLIVDAGEIITTATGGVEIILASPLSVSKEDIIWLAFLQGVAACQMRAMQASGVVGALGVGSLTDLYPTCGYSKAQAYGVLPAAFPAAPLTREGNQITAVMVRIQP